MKPCAPICACWPSASVMFSSATMSFLFWTLLHIHVSIYKLAKQKIRLMYVPAKMTRFLQLCDTHVFSTFKAALKENWRRRRVRCPEGRMGTEDWLRAIFKTINNIILTKDWSHAFGKVGLSYKQHALSEQVCKILGWNSTQSIPCIPLPPDEARCIFSERLRIDVTSYVEWIPASQRHWEQQSLPRRRTLPPILLRKAWIEQLTRPLAAKLLARLKSDAKTGAACFRLCFVGARNLGC